MGFWDSLGEAAGKAIKNASDDFSSTSERAGNYSDERLAREFKSTTNMAKKMAYANELRNRGYGNQD
jgi:hypothetical protein